MPDQLTPLAGREAQQVDIIKPHTVCGDAPVIFRHAADGFGDQAFA